MLRYVSQDPDHGRMDCRIIPLLYHVAQYFHHRRCLRLSESFFFESLYKLEGIKVVISCPSHGCMKISLESPISYACKLVHLMIL